MPAVTRAMVYGDGVRSEANVSPSCRFNGAIGLQDRLLALFCLKRQVDDQDCR